MNKKLIRFINILSTVSILIIIFLIIKFLGNTFISHEDIYISFYPNIKEYFLNPKCSDYISSFLCILFGLKLPMLLGIHPSDFKAFYFIYIELGIILLYPILLFKIFIMDISKRIKVFSSLIFLFMLIVFLFIVQSYEKFFFVYETLFRMMLPVLYWMGLLYLLLKNNRNRLDYVYMYICGFLCCFSNEMIALSSLLGVILYQIIQINRKKSIDTKILLLLFFMALGLGLYVNAGAFLRQGSAEHKDLLFLISVLKEIPEFSICYLKEIFLKHISLYIVMAICLYGLYFNAPKNEEKNNRVVLSLSFLVGILIFFYLLIFLKKTHYMYNQYWLIHWDLHYMYNIMLFALELVLFNLLIRYRKIKRKYIIGCILAVVIVLTSFNCYLYKQAYEIRKYKKISVYKLEKTIRLANLLKRRAIVYYDIPMENCWWLYTPHMQDIKTIGPIKLLNRFDKEHQIKGKFIIWDRYHAEKAFKENGGYYTEKELKELRFNNLLNDDYVLGKNNPE